VSKFLTLQKQFFSPLKVNIIESIIHAQNPESIS